MNDRWYDEADLHDQHVREIDRATRVSAEDGEVVDAEVVDEPDPWGPPPTSGIFGGLFGRPGQR
ncbi:MAG TPA: hypothetical protein VMU34_08035 [Mycobacterium sp.]|nr:hypothetical protein [Mycobacterium sp.]